MFQRILENGGANNTANFLNFFNIAGDPRDYAWGNTGWDNIITQQAGYVILRLILNLKI